MEGKVFQCRKGGYMDYVLRTIGILILVGGSIYVVNPTFTRKVIEFAKVGKRVYIGGAVRIVIGLLLLFSIKSATFPWIPGIIGALALLAGIAMFALGLPRMHAFMDKIYNLPDSRLRLLPLIAVLIGVLLIYSA